MKEPIKWFTDAVNLGKYDDDVITEIKSCISKDGFDISKFMEWASEQIEQDLGDD